MTMDKDSPVARSVIRFGDGEVFHLPTTDNKAVRGLLVYDGNVWKRDEMSNNLQSQALQGSVPLPSANPHYQWVADPPLFEPTGVPEVDALAKVLEGEDLLDKDYNGLSLIQEHLDKIAEAIQAVTRREVEKVRREAAEEMARVAARAAVEVAKARADALTDLITQYTSEMRVDGQSVMTATITDVPVTPDLVERVRNRITGIGT